MPTSQSGIFALGTRSHYYLEFDLADGAEARALVQAAARLREPKMTTGGANLVTCFGAAAWASAGGELPPGCTAFEAITGADGFTMPASQHDAWVWVSGTGYDVVFDAARAVTAALAPVASLATEQGGFSYRESLDLTGFQDGTANPPVDEAALLAAVATGPGAGGSIVLVQKWVHDLGAFHALSEADQEAVIGRTKDHSEELAEQPARSHLSRVVIEDDNGEEIEIFRRSASFGTVAEHGLMFVGFGADQARFDTMLKRMAGAQGVGRDRLTEFSTPVSGGYYFAPSVQAMRELAGLDA